LLGVDYLRGLSGTAKNGPGPAECGRVSCSDYSAIYWCNDVSRGGRIRDLGARGGLWWLTSVLKYST
ncbi:hypothetical protein QBC36DRAFT_190692, partial [Triangularia setosa]